MYLQRRKCDYRKSFIFKFLSCRGVLIIVPYFGTKGLEFEIALACLVSREKEHSIFGMVVCSSKKSGQKQVCSV